MTALFISAWVSPPTGAWTVDDGEAGVGAVVAVVVAVLFVGDGGLCAGDCFGCALAEGAGCRPGSSPLRASRRDARFSSSAARSVSLWYTVSACATALSGLLPGDADTNSEPIAENAMTVAAEYNLTLGRATEWRPRR
ncbi:hypothetical protein [Dactylosporangium sp. NPDC048998]|uniref:hypothetical protein n=1 Tax=Dactylosporangium sp. NPDC048998 TaxID=3363976 RepID=UPI003722ABB5